MNKSSASNALQLVALSLYRVGKWNSWGISGSWQAMRHSRDSTTAHFWKQWEDRCVAARLCKRILLLLQGRWDSIFSWKHFMAMIIFLWGLFLCNAKACIWWSFVDLTFSNWTEVSCAKWMHSVPFSLLRRTTYFVHLLNCWRVSTPMFNGLLCSLYFLDNILCKLLSYYWEECSYLYTNLQMQKLVHRYNMMKDTK